MPSLEKVWVARFFGSKEKKAFHTEKVIAPSFASAEEKAWDWAEKKWPNRVREVHIERSKGEVLV